MSTTDIDRSVSGMVRDITTKLFLTEIDADEFAKRLSMIRQWEADRRALAEKEPEK